MKIERQSKPLSIIRPYCRKSDYLCAFMYYAEKARKIPSSESLFMDAISEEVSQIKVSIKDIF